jgi:hypothetical protein
MCHRGKAELSVDAFAILLKESAPELGPIVCDDAIGDAKSIDDRFKEGNDYALGKVYCRGKLLAT